jgi:hypothetical protein
MASARGKKAAAKRRAKRTVGVAKRKPVRSAKKRKGTARAKKSGPSRARGRLGRPRTAANVVANAKQLLSDGNTYPKGCSEFVCAVLGIGYKVAKDIMGSGADVDGNSIGSAPDYTSASAGDICGWLQADAISSPPADHVTVYIGEADAKFIDVRSPGNKPRALKNGYGDQQVWKAQRASARKRRL